MSWLVLACSGPGAMKAIENNERGGWLLFVIAAGIAIATAVLAVLKRRPSRWMYATVGSALINPGFWMSARGGDCGATLYLGAIVGLSLTGVLALAASITVLRNRGVSS